MAERACDGATEDELLAAAERCLIRLEDRLGDAPYFFGDRPSLLDAKVYGFVAVLRAAAMPNPWLLTAVTARQKLLRHCDRIEKLHFPEVARQQVCLFDL